MKEESPSTGSEDFDPKYGEKTRGHERSQFREQYDLIERGSGPTHEGLLSLLQKTPKTWGPRFVHVLINESFINNQLTFYRDVV